MASTASCTAHPGWGCGRRVPPQCYAPRPGPSTAASAGPPSAPHPASCIPALGLHSFLPICSSCTTVRRLHTPVDTWPGRPPRGTHPRCCESLPGTKSAGSRRSRGARPPAGGAAPGCCRRRRSAAPQLSAELYRARTFKKRLCRGVLTQRI